MIEYLRSNAVPLGLSVALHSVLVALLISGIGLPRHIQPVAAPPVVQATVVDQERVEEELRQIEEAEQRERERREEELRQQQEQAEDVRRKREQEEQQLAAAKQEREKAEKELARKREADAEAERKRVADLAAKREADERAERKREADLKARREAEAEERKRKEEAERQRLAELERKRKQEEERLAKIEQQRKQEEERRQRELEAQRQRESESLLAQQLAEEEKRVAAQRSGLLGQYMALIRQKVERSWIKPPSAQPGLKCTVQVSQIPGGEVVSVRVARCNGDDAVVRSVEAAVWAASPLPLPADPSLFERSLSLEFAPTE